MPPDRGKPKRGLGPASLRPGHLLARARGISLAGAAAAIPVPKTNRNPVTAIHPAMSL
ncbi:MAG: hypothetical protein IIA63_12205 [Nitrospinae bacterium]|nr:hypothetical protein [Nitrospinota bacterium]